MKNVKYLWVLLILNLFFIVFAKIQSFQDLVKNGSYYVYSVSNKVKLVNGIYQNKKIKVFIDKYDLLEDEQWFPKKIGAVVLVYQNDKNKIFELTGMVYDNNRYYQLNNKILGKDIYVENLKIKKIVDYLPFNNRTIVSVEFYVPTRTLIKDYLIVKDSKSGLFVLKDYDEEDVPVVKKPAIYFYPPYDNFKVSVKLKVNGKILKSDPAFVNSWDLVANTDGNIFVKGKRFRYLFYENTLNEPVEMEDNYWVISKDRVDLLKVLFVSLGLNERESQDFYDYVKGELGKTGANYFKVSRVSYDYLQKNMVLNISPKPDNLIRIILVFQPFNDPRKIPDFDKKINKVINTLIYPERDKNKFNVVEWGTIIDNRLMK